MASHWCTANPISLLAPILRPCWESASARLVGSPDNARVRVLGPLDRGALVPGVGTPDEPAQPERIIVPRMMASTSRFTLDSSPGKNSSPWNDREFIRYFASLDRHTRRALHSRSTEHSVQRSD